MKLWDVGYSEPTVAAEVSVLQSWKAVQMR